MYDEGIYRRKRNRKRVRFRTMGRKIDENSIWFRVNRDVRGIQSECTFILVVYSGPFFHPRKFIPFILTSLIEKTFWDPCQKIFGVDGFLLSFSRPNAI